MKKICKPCFFPYPSHFLCFPYRTQVQFVSTLVLCIPISKYSFKISGKGLGGCMWLYALVTFSLNCQGRLISVTKADRSGFWFEGTILITHALILR